MNSTHHLQGQFFLPLSSQSQAAQLTIVVTEAMPPTISIALEDGSSIPNLVLEDMQDSGDFHFHNGYYFHPDAPPSTEVRNLFTTKRQRRIQWLEDFSAMKALGFAIGLVLLVIGLRFSIPVIAHGLALAVPDPVEQMIGQHTYDTLKSFDFEDSTIAPERQETLRQRAQVLARNANLDPVPAILFHKSPMFGANALALPGGPIVLTDDLVNGLKSDDVILAVIAHEMAHVEKHHALQQVFTIAGAAFMASVVLGVDDSILEELTATVINVWGFQNSRKFEQEADMFGIEILKTSAMSPSLMLQAIESLTIMDCTKLTEEERQTCEAKAKSQETGWTASHPAAKDRLTYLRAAASQ